MASTLRHRGTPLRNPSRRIPRPILFTGLGLLCVLALAGALLVGMRLARAGALPGTVVEGTDVGGLEGEALHVRIAAAGNSDLVVTVTFQGDEVSARGSEIGYRVDVDATAEAVLRRGRQGNPVAALRDHVRAFSSAPVEVPLSHDVDGAVLQRWAGQVAGALDRPPVEATLRFADGAVERVEPADGIEIDAGAVAELAEAALLEGAEATFEAPGELKPTETTTAALDEIAALAERALAGSVTLRRGDAGLTVTPAEISGLLEVERDGGNLALELDAGRLDGLVGEQARAEFDSEPVDARVELAGGSVTITESTDGFRFDAEIAAEQLLEVATADGPREAELAGETVAPELSTADAEALEIVEQVSSFTTHFQCCQSRVTNIQLIADMLDGVLVKPGETLSVNSHVGRRTVEKGFVAGGAILDGEFVEQIGGGVSQFATTMYNAAFFGGYEIPDYKAHSYYISRYPVGREATLNYPDVDLKVHNNSPYGLLVDTSHTSTSVTVSFWGKTWVAVSDITGERSNVREPPERERENPDLAPGAARVVQSGREGFDITVVRILEFPDGREEREQIFTRYLPEPRVVEHNTAPPPEDDPEPPDDDPEPPDDDPDPPDGDGDG